MNRKMRRAQKQKLRADMVPAFRGGMPADTAFIAKRVASLFSESLRCLASGQTAKAVALCDRILSLKPDLPEAHCNRGVALAQLGKLHDAEQAYRQVIALRPDHPEAYSNLGEVLRCLGRLDDADKAVRYAIALQPQFADAFSNLGNTLRERGSLDQAEAAYREAIALRPGFPEAHNNLGTVLVDLGRPQDAESALRQAIALSPRFAVAFCNLGNALRDQGKLTEAEAACRQAIALKQRFAEAHNNLANVLLDLGQPENAERELRHAIAFHPQFAEAFSNLGNALRDQGRLAEAEAACRWAIALKPTLADAHHNLSTILKYFGRLAEAREAAEQAMQLGSRNALYLLNLGELRQFGAGDCHLDTMEDLARNVASRPVKQQIELHFALAKAYEDVGRFDDSFRALVAGNALKRRQVVYDETATSAVFERIRQVFTPGLMQRFRGCGEPSSVPVFIVGMPRSGTTLVEQILASHPQVFGAGELPGLGNALDSIRPTGGTALPLPDLMANVSGEDLRRLGQRYVSEITRLAPAATRIVDKMPSNFLFAGLIHLVLPNARIIHVVRDPVDTCVSCFSKLFAAGQHHTYDLAELGRYYRHYQALMQHWHRVLPPERILDVRYEDVVVDLQGEARRLIAHCGLEWDTRCLAFHETQRPVHTASASQVRQPLYRTAIGRAQCYESFLKPLRAALSGDPGPDQYGSLASSTWSSCRAKSAIERASDKQEIG